MATHTGDAAHTCSVCQKSFTQLDNFNVHMATHMW